ncbi:AraC family transcriptional regulator [Fusobacterium pseudoperiodonticum]|mgnify:FL=1|nr:MULTISPECIES: GyrI-like domain-containing protein [Fusobacterium]ATV60306.1 AraC family transcriptional regulator [Fusobacterium pseudoperiodonticum]ATV67065.1 AraC family transcriptional regulator [Fusobacterium pseudoperiodonticum]
MAYTLKAVTIRTNNSEEGIRKIGELWGDVLTGKLSLLADGVVPISQYSNYESDEKGDYDISIVGVEHNFFEDIEKEVEKGLYKKYEAVDENGNVEMCTKKAWENVWNDTHSGVLKRAFTVDFESSVPKEFSKDGKAHCYLYIAMK